jgi:4-oxalocrotonate tautomerase
MPLNFRRVVSCLTDRDAGGRLMPVVTIQMEKGRPLEMKRALADAVTTAVAGALDVPADWVTLISTKPNARTGVVGGRLQLDKLGPGYGRAGVNDAASGRR